MSLFPCTACNERKPGKLANVTVAWWTAAQQRVAWRARLCLACYMAHVAMLHGYEGTEVLVCPFCGIDTADDMDPCYVTSFVPLQGKVQLELASCGACAAKFRVWAQGAGVRLSDIGVGGQDPGPQPIPPGTEGWAAVGIYPRE